MAGLPTLLTSQYIQPGFSHFQIIVIHIYAFFSSKKKTWLKKGIGKDRNQEESHEGTYIYVCMCVCVCVFIS